MLIWGNYLAILSVVTVLVHVLGVFNAAHAVMHVRSSRGAIAWSISLITFPWLAIPLYWILGRSQFQGYAEALHTVYVQHRELVHQTHDGLLEFRQTLPQEFQSLQKLAEQLDSVAFTSGNGVELLLDGKQTFEAMLETIASAKQYILLQCYILNDDGLGNQFRRALIHKAKQGVQIYLLYDGIGSYKLPRAYVQSLREHGIYVSAFKSTKGRGNRFQLNFRNHRKILIVDGETAFVGGLNIGDEYLGKHPPLSPWRDTHLKARGPSVQCLQRVFLSDWYWAVRAVPDVTWTVRDDRTYNETVFVFPTGPVDSLQACTLFFVDAINQAQERLWIATPYFVPDDSVLTALKLAALRGVDVRILLPNRPDHWLVYLCSFTYYAEMETAGVKLYRYRPGFMHQKVILIDRRMAGVGTVNLDNRSFFLNFEVTLFNMGMSFVQNVETMLQSDLGLCRLVERSEYDQRPLWFKLAARVSRLLAPVL